MFVIQYNIALITLWRFLLNIYLTRHGQTEWNLKGVMQGGFDSPLTEKGIEDAMKLHSKLENVNFNIAFSSTQGRAIKTAEIILKNNNKKIIKTKDLREIGVGIWQGMTYEFIQNNYKSEFELYTNKPESYSPIEGGESYEVFESRVKNFVNNIVKNEYNNILIVTHGVTYIMLLNIFDEKELKFLVDRKIPVGTALSKIKYENNKFKILYEDDISHL